MENINKDLLPLIAFDLNYPDILRFCQLSKRINNFICRNEHFWRSKLYLDYPSLRNYRYDNYREAYKSFVKERFSVLQSVNSKKLENYGRLGFINEIFSRFLQNADFGFIGKVPVIVLITPLLKLGILSRSMALKLLIIYLYHHELNFTINDVDYFKVDKYLDEYLNFLNLNFNRNKLSKYNLKTIAEKSFIRKDDVNQERQNLSKDKEILKELSKIDQILLSKFEEL